MVRHVARRALDFGLGPVVVATDDQRVVEAVAGLGVETVVSQVYYASGTERVAAVARFFPEAEIVVNLQGDEPLLPYEAAAGALARVLEGDEIGTAAGRLEPSDLWHPDRVKVAVDEQGRARSFFRTPARVGGGLDSVHRHVGVYAYTREALLRWVALDPVAEESALRLEQLRPLAYGMKIGVRVLDGLVPHGVDTESDLRAVDLRIWSMSRG